MQQYRTKLELIKELQAEPVPSHGAISRRAWVQEFIQRRGARRYSRQLRAEGMSREALGDDYVRRLELAGLGDESLDRVLPEVRSLEAWPVQWENEGDRLLGLGDAAGASAAYYMAQRWVWISPAEQERLYRKAAVLYGELQHSAPLEHVTVQSGDRSIATIIQVPDRLDGPAPVLLMFPGLTGAKEELHPFAEAALAAGVAVCRVDLPGYGSTTGHMDEDAEVLAKAVLNTLVEDPRLDPERAHTLGFCTGGLYAASAAHDGGVASVTLVSTPVQPLRYLDRQPPGMMNALRKAMGLQSIRHIAEQLGRLKLIAPSRLQCAVNLVYGGKDAMIPPSEMNRVIAYAPGPVEVVFFEEQPHACVGRFEDIVAVLLESVNGEHANAGEAAA